MLSFSLDIPALATKQLLDYDRHRPGCLFAGYSIPMTVDDAYTLQTAVADLRVERGEAIAGYKVGCVSPLIQVQLELDRPVFGYVFGSEIYNSGVLLDPNEFDGLAIEGELAVRIAADIPDAEWVRNHPDELISAGFAVIELHNYVFRNARHTAQELIGNNAIHAGVVLPMTEPALNDPSELVNTSLQVFLNGTPLATATGGMLPGGPFGSLVRLAEHLQVCGRTLRRNDLVLTGSPLPLYRVSGGARIEVICSRSETVVAMVLERGDELAARHAPAQNVNYGGV